MRKLARVSTAVHARTAAEFWMNLQCRYDLWQAAETRARRKESKIQTLAQGS